MSAALPGAPSASRSTFSDNASRIVRLAWPVFVGQISVLAFSTVDTLLVARHSSLDLAALAVGAAAYMTIFIGFMGVLLALSPIVGQLYGAGRHAEAGAQAHQAVWVALGLACLGCTLLAFPAPFMALAQATPELEHKVRGYLFALAFSLPASLMFTIYRAFNTAVSRPKAVMALQVGGLALKVPLSTALVFGVPALHVPALGVLGCGIATAVAMWSQVLIAWLVVRRDPFYAPFGVPFGRRAAAAADGSDAALALTRRPALLRPQRAGLLAQLRLGLPMGGSILIEVSGFTFMAIFIARLGSTPVAGHQIAANLVALLFMMPLALASATSTLVAQRIGAQDPRDARRLGWHGVLLGCAIAALMGSAVYLARVPIVGIYTGDAAVAAAALPLLAWVALFHIADAAQTLAGFVLRAYRIATVTLVVYAVAIWGLGLGGGFLLAFDAGGRVPSALHGAPGFWIAATAGLVLAALALCAVLGFVLKRQVAAAPAGA